MERYGKTPLTALSRSLRPAICLPPVAIAGPVTEGLAAYADDRHRVGPLLHLACQAGLAAEDRAVVLLQSSYRNNVLNNLRQKAAARKIAARLESHALPFSFLKGQGLAEQLYDDPNARKSKDVDLLVSPATTRDVIRLLNEEGYIYKAHALTRHKMFALSRQNMDIKIVKDLVFWDPDLSVQIELHSRLFTFEPAGLTTDFRDAVRSGPTPSVSSGFYCLYLLLHGALALWPRLKWLTDLSILVRKMPAESRTDMMTLARSYGCEGAVSASLELVEDIFPDSLDEEWLTLMEPVADIDSSRRLKQIFYRSLSAGALEKPSLPLKSYLLSGTADLVFPGKINMLHSLVKRFMNSATIRI